MGEDLSGDSIIKRLAQTVAGKPSSPALASYVIETEAELCWYTWEEIQADVEAEIAGKPLFEITDEFSDIDIDWYYLDSRNREIIESLAALSQKVEFSPTSPYRLSGISDDVATVAKTAGTSGEPRGVMLTHENLLSNAVALSEASGGDGDELRLSFLPMEHLYARTCDLYTWIIRGSRLVLAESPKTVFRDAKLVRPTTINGVPYFFQKAVDLADREGVSLKELLGGEIRRCYCGGAALSPIIEQRFFDEGVPLYTGYGLTEASPVVTVNTPDAHKLGTVGKPLPGVEVRIADDGEVLVKGPNVMLGYWNDPEATAETIRDGWLHTGDLGELDSEGFLTITGRKKELIVLSTGKNVAPSRVEALLAASPWIEQACVLGDDQKGLRALIVPNPDRLRSEVKRRRLWVWSKRGALRHEAIRALYREEINRCLAGAAKEEQVHAFALMGRGFDKDRGEMTAKLSLRREAIQRGFSREIASIS